MCVSPPFMAVLSSLRIFKTFSPPLALPLPSPLGSKSAVFQVPIYIFIIIESRFALSVSNLNRVRCSTLVFFFFFQFRDFGVISDYATCTRIGFVLIGFIWPGVWGWIIYSNCIDTYLWIIYQIVWEYFISKRDSWLKKIERFILMKLINCILVIIKIFIKICYQHISIFFIFLKFYWKSSIY